MKKIKSLFMLLAIFFLFPFMVNAEEANVTIESVVLDESASTQGVVTSEPQVTGLSIDFGLEFSNVGDKVVYRAIFNNNDTEDYALTLPEAKDGEYVTYQYAFEDGNNVLMAKSKKTLVITIEYKNEVPDDVLDANNGKYRDANRVQLTLVNNEGKVTSAGTNPKTGQSLLIIGLLAIAIIVSSYVVYKNNKSAKNLVLLVAAGLFIIPMTIYALKELSITINSSVGIAKEREFCVINLQSGPATYDSYTYRTGTTLGEYLKGHSVVASMGDNKLNPNRDFVTSLDDNTCGTNVAYYIEKSHLGDADNSEYKVMQNGESVILDSEHVCYFLTYNYCNESPDTPGQ